MTSISYRNTVFAVVPEDTEGTPKAPTGAGDFIALQDDFAMSFDTDRLENAELKASLGRAKALPGGENPTANGSHYLRHSGVEGTAPNYGEVIKALFGTENVDADEETTDAGSTTEVVVLTANGSHHPRGTALLVKDPVNGYSIRPVHSQTGENLTVGFELGAAPGAGVNVGKAVTYIPADTGHQTLSLWEYLGNSGAIRMIAGARVTEMAMTFTARELINAAYSYEGLEYYFDPIEIAAADTYLDFTDDNGTFAAQITAKMYKDPHELAAAIQTAMNTVQTAETHACIYSDTTGKFTISTSTSAVLSLLWNTGGNAANNVGDKIGFSTAADDTGSTSYISDSAQDYSAPYTPTYDSTDPLVAKNNQVMIGDADDNACFSASSVTATIGVPKADKNSVCAVSGKDGSIPSERTVTIVVSGYLDKYDVDKFRRFRENTETRFAYVFGSKSGGNWVAGKCGCLYAPTTSITSFEIGESEGLSTIDFTLETFVNDSGNGEIYISWV